MAKEKSPICEQCGGIAIATKDLRWTHDAWDIRQLKKRGVKIVERLCEPCAEKVRAKALACGDGEDPVTFDN